MDKLGRWTEKAASHGVKNDMDFLDRPEAQEQAMTDVLRVYDNQIHAFGLDGYVGQTIKDTAGSPSACLGIVAAGHRAGARAVKRRFTTHDGRQKGHRRPGYKNRSLHCKALA